MRLTDTFLARHAGQEFATYDAFLAAIRECSAVELSHGAVGGVVGALGRQGAVFAQHPGPVVIRNAAPLPAKAPDRELVPA